MAFASSSSPSSCSSCSSSSSSSSSFFADLDAELASLRARESKLENKIIPQLQRKVQDAWWTSDKNMHQHQLDKAECRLDNIRNQSMTLTLECRRERAQCLRDEQQARARQAECHWFFANGWDRVAPLGIGMLLAVSSGFALRYAPFCLERHAMKKYSQRQIQVRKFLFGAEFPNKISESRHRFATGVFDFSTRFSFIASLREIYHLTCQTNSTPELRKLERSIH